ncbi:fungal specific transcription factor domain-containing protein [Aspergillus alliaceus]|uniref:fungal specific transcription factor domain-containing protein n=1 Tax=Petromyces alliaceus TaxID=209559 RepID=UPI0012A55412|nr:fungal-specific transcription factor domain-containing protein [Aspergillus alliaceus]KAB8236454.1 fungal-specific transcription factor domain-containing protein [Aspergillus alliaceus]
MEVQLQERPTHASRTESDSPNKIDASIPPLTTARISTNINSGSNDVENQSYLSSPSKSQPDEDNIQSNTDSEANRAPYVINAEGARMRYFGASSGFSIASPQGMKWLEGETRSGAWRSASQRTAPRWQLSSWYPRILQGDLGQRVSQPLPSKSTTVQLVGEYFSAFNRVMPLFHEGTVMRLVDKQFGWNPDESPSWWASLNVILASAYRERAQQLPDGSDEWQKSMGHIRNALNVVVELFMRAADLLAVQAMLGLAILFQNTPNPQPLFMFAAAGMRLSHSVGLHRNQTFGLSPSEIEERRRTFWIAFILDADISHRTGRPPVQDANDFDTPLPSESPHDGIGVVDVQGARLGYFHLLARFALIQHQVYSHLYTTSVQTKITRDLIGELKNCQEALLEWRISFEKHYVPELAFSNAPHYHLQHVLRLDFAYHCCYAKLYQVCILVRRPMAQAPEDLEDYAALDGQVNDTLVRSLESARSAVRLIKHVNLFGPSFAWGVLYFPAAASVILSSHLLANPFHQHAASDLAMAHETIKFLSRISSEDPGTYVDYILSLCSELESAAKKASSQAAQDLSRQPMENINNSMKEPGGSVSNLTMPFHMNFATPQSEGMDLTRSAISQNYDMSTVDPTFDLAMNLQWPIPPFWNWGDMTTGSDENTNNEQAL